MKLAGQKQGKESETAEGETAVTARKAAPAIMQQMVVSLGTDLVGNKDVFRRAWFLFKGQCGQLTITPMDRPTGLQRAIKSGRGLPTAFFIV